jgi:hypothetical protein
METAFTLDELIAKLVDVRTRVPGDTPVKVYKDSSDDSHSIEKVYEPDGDEEPYCLLYIND